MPSPHYKPLSQDDGDEEQQFGVAPRVQNRHKRLLFHILAVAAVMYVSFLGVRAISRSSKMRMGKPCHAVHRNLSSLPSHYTLPSGHKIPSVALGEYITMTGRCVFDSGANEFQAFGRLRRTRSETL